MAAPPAKVPRLLAGLRTHGGCTKTALAKVLCSLRDEGLLNSDLAAGAERAVRERIATQIEDCAMQSTPFGKLIQRMPTGLDDVPYLEVVNPFAWLWALCNISACF